MIYPYLVPWSLVFAICFSFQSSVDALDQSPIATLTCQLCLSGNALAYTLLPNGTTCQDLDIALRNIGRSGCSLAGDSNGGGSQSGSTTNDSQLASQKAYSSRLLAATIVLSLLIVVIIAICIFSLYRIKKHYSPSSTNVYRRDDTPEGWGNSQSHLA